MLKKIIRINASDLYILLVPVGLFLLLQLITGGVMLFGKPETGVQVSSILLLVLSVVLSLILVIGHGIMSFEQAVRMGMTRKRALGQYVGLSVVLTGAVFAVSAALSLLEQLLGSYVWPALSPGVEIKNFAQMLPWWGYPAAFFGSLIVGISCGAGIQRFGGKFGWGMWGVWLLWFFVLDRLPWKHEQITGGLIPAVAVLVAALFVWSVWSYLHAVIKR